ncbi:MAG: hypothetical protein IPK80_20790 [Nannocystis sp.]|nr:hypothetical protein [Nannocystis sp.]
MTAARRYVSGQRDPSKSIAIDTLLADANPNGVLHTGSSTSPTYLDDHGGLA